MAWKTQAIDARARGSAIQSLKILRGACIMSIAFRCSSCDRNIRIADEKAGRKVKCPDCGAVLVVPGGEEDAERPLPAGRRRSEEDDRPRGRSGGRRRRKKLVSTLLLLLIPSLFLLGGVALVATWWFFQPGSPGSPGGSALGREMKYVPDGFGSIRTMRVDQILASPAYKALRNDWPDPVIENNPDYRGFRAEEVARLTRADGTGGHVFILTLKRTVTAEEIMAGVRFSRWEEQRVGRYTVYKREHSMADGFSVPESDIVLFGNPKTLTAILARNGSPDLSEETQGLLRLVDFEKSMVTFGYGQGTDVAVRGDNPLSIEHKVFLRKRIIDLKASQSELGTDVSTTVTYGCKDAESAGELKKIIEEATVKATAKSGNEAQELLRGQTITVSGSTLTVRNTQKPEAIIRWLKKERRTFFVRPL
jgi:DNA-directed RNA polymerase subunit RPC12/RpoP